MDTQARSQNQQTGPDLKARVVQRVGQVIVLIAFQAALLFLSAGRLDWTWAWVFLGLYVGGIIINGAFLLRYNPQTIAERATATGMRDWDKVVGGLFGALYFVGIPLLAGLDQRFGWSSLPLAVHLAGAVAFVLGLGLFSWSMVANAHFATVVRIGKEGEHAVCDRGPYAHVRHPGYVGGFLQALVLPLILGSLWALLAGAAAALLLVVRTMLEDRTLREDLPGYEEYAGRVRYRLVPGIW
jgi:protein-S-isoprenylcysteine O-methyltransferase Ste14